MELWQHLHIFKCAENMKCGEALKWTVATDAGDEGMKENDSVNCRSCTKKN
jgi:hypothetical protein